MEDQIDVISELRVGNVLAGLQWAFRSAVARTLDDYSEDAGHDAAWLGNTRFTFFRDRLDRVFSCGRYELDGEADPAQGVDLVHAQLSKADVDTMPRVDASRVSRSDLNHSPGWQIGSRRFLLASAAFGKVDRLPWPRKSETKQRVARQTSPDPPPSLFDDLASAEIAGILALLAERSLDLQTYVIAHSLDPFSQKSELVFGRPRFNDGGGKAWYWKVDLHEAIPVSEYTTLARVESSSHDGNEVPDADVRLRPSGNSNRPEERKLQ